MSEQNKAATRRFYDAINAGQLDTILGLMTPGFIEHEEFPGIPPNAAGVRQLFEVLRTAFPDFRIEVDALLAEGDVVAARGRMTGTHRGEFMGMAATGKTMATPFADFIRFEGGKAAEHWGVTDSGAMMQQLS